MKSTVVCTMHNLSTLNTRFRIKGSHLANNPDLNSFLTPPFFNSIYAIIANTTFWCIRWTLLIMRPENDLQRSKLKLYCSLRLDDKLKHTCRYHALSQFKTKKIDNVPDNTEWITHLTANSQCLVIKTYQQEIYFFHPSLRKPLQPYSTPKVFYGKLELLDRMNHWSNLVVR